MTGNSVIRFFTNHHHDANTPDQGPDARSRLKKFLTATNWEMAIPEL